MRSEKEFFEEVDKVCQKSFQEIMEKLKEINIPIIEFHYEVELPYELRKEFEIPNIRIVIEAKISGGEAVYYYKDEKVDFINFWDSEISTLSLLQQCEVQDTNIPNNTKNLSLN